MNLETQIYALLLKLYPTEFRDRHAKAMLETYTDALHTAKLEGRTAGFHFRVALDLISSLISIRLEVMAQDRPGVFARLTAAMACLFLLKVTHESLVNHQWFSPIASQYVYLFSLAILGICGWFATTKKPLSERALFALIASVFLSAGIVLTLSQTLPLRFDVAADMHIFAIWYLPYRGLLLTGFVLAILRSLELRRLSRWWLVCLLWPMFALLIPGPRESSAWAASDVFLLCWLSRTAVIYWRQKPSRARTA